MTLFDSLKKKENKKMTVIGLSVIMILLVIGGIVSVFFRKAPRYASVLGMNWGISLPDEAHFKEVYAQDSGASFHGDGIRYHVFEYKHEDYVERMLDWKTVESKTVYHTGYSEAAKEWLSEISAEKAYYPNFEDCFYWYKVQKDSSEIIIFWDREANLLSVLESFL